MACSVHQPVLRTEVLSGLRVQPDAVCIDATLGGGGHAEALLEASVPHGRLLGLDRDPEALARTAARLAHFGSRFQAVHGNFADIRVLAESHGFLNVDAILMDLGVSSDQLDTPERGFSFRFDAPLDMRMDPTRGPTAAEWLATATETEIANVIFRYGEDRASRRIAKRIVETRGEHPIRTTTGLATLVETAVGGRKGARIHPATRTFQALRMVVNDELTAVERGLEGALQILKPGGRLAVISFHSLEDRIVKQTFRRHEGREISLYEGGSEWRGDLPRVTRVTRKPVEAGEQERASNPRARSAKLRIIEKGQENDSKT
ncbi:MAG: 16S rRNA (cytosine(1402)-N(4))-methyltransferase RsmH [Verrucomicrobia bacterium]|nr:16S rRNA (cytosine(1402)-N(4))-methyltransferase RsmH [Verrucomicrobiota bacterium]MCH8510873.1 16S rRNA (cytosine(1402)-N(4))-methyltransferase RsmH [Kiritimatiellia bacterium]